MESTERPQPHHLAEKLPAAIYTTAPETLNRSEEGEKVEVGRESSRTRSESIEKVDEEPGSTPAAIDFPDGGLRAWR